MPSSLVSWLVQQQQRVWPVELDIEQLLHAAPTPFRSTVEAVRDIQTLEVVDYTEKATIYTGDAKTSMAMNRSLGDGALGSQMQKPFVPGGMSLQTVGVAPAAPADGDGESEHTESTFKLAAEMHSRHVEVACSLHGEPCV